MAYNWYMDQATKTFANLFLKKNKPLLFKTFINGPNNIRGKPPMILIYKETKYRTKYKIP